MIVILKIPIVYLCLVVWWAIRSEPEPLEGAPLPAVMPEDRPWNGWRRTPDRPPRRGPNARLAAAAVAIAAASFAVGMAIAVVTANPLYLGPLLQHVA